MTWLTSLGGALWRVVGSALSAPESAPIASIGKTVLTVGEVRSAYAGLPVLTAAIEHIVTGSATLDDGVTIAEDVLSGAAMLDPPLAPLIAIAEALLPAIAAAVASGAISRPSGNWGTGANLDPLKRR